VDKVLARVQSGLAMKSLPFHRRREKSEPLITLRVCPMPVVPLGLRTRTRVCLRHEERLRQSPRRGKPFRQSRHEGNPPFSLPHYSAGSQVNGIRSPRCWRKNRPKPGFFTSKRGLRLGGFSGGARIFTRFSPTH
jgi:hypothetical protein